MDVQQPEQSQSTLQPPVQHPKESPIHAPPKRTPWKKIILILIAFLITLLVAGGGVFIWQNYQKAVTPSPPTSSITIVYPEEWTFFRSKLLNIGFEYPSEWGEVFEEIREATEDETRFSENKPGKVYTLRFSNKTELEFPQNGTTYKLPYLAPGHLPTAYAQGFSREFKPGCPGECCHIYHGDLKKPAEVEISFNNYSVADRCCHEYVGTQCQPRDSLNGSIYFNLPNNEINGVQLVIPTLSENGRQKVNSILEGEDVCKFDNQFEPCSENYFTNASEMQIELEKMLKQKESLDEESLIYMRIFERIAQSAKIY